jgi:hypothetical protein
VRQTAAPGSMAALLAERTGSVLLRSTLVPIEQQNAISKLIRENAIVGEVFSKANYLKMRRWHNVIDDLGVYALPLYQKPFMEHGMWRRIQIQQEFEGNNPKISPDQRLYPSVPVQEWATSQQLWEGVIATWFPKNYNAEGVVVGYMVNIMRQLYHPPSVDLAFLDAFSCIPKMIIEHLVQNRKLRKVLMAAIIEAMIPPAFKRFMVDATIREVLGDKHACCSFDKFMEILRDFSVAYEHELSAPTQQPRKSEGSRSSGAQESDRKVSFQQKQKAEESNAKAAPAGGGKTLKAPKLPDDLVKKFSDRLQERSPMWLVVRRNM